MFESSRSIATYCGKDCTDKTLKSAKVTALTNNKAASFIDLTCSRKGAEEGSDLIYDFNSLKSLPNGVKQIDTYQPRIKAGDVTYISCSKWRHTEAGGEWNIIPPGSKIEALAYKVCGKS